MSAMTPDSSHLAPRKEQPPRMQREAYSRAVVLLVSLAVCGWGAMAWPASFWPGYLAAMTFWTSVSLGCLGLGLLHPLTAGRWGWGMGRELHAGMATIVLMILTVVPLIFAGRWVFPWVRSLSDLNPHQQQYLAPQWVLLRTIGEWMLWTLLAGWLIRGYRRTAREPAFRLSPRKAAVGLILFWFTVTAASVDGLMSLDPSWMSSMFGAIQVLGCVVAGLSWVLIVRRHAPVAREEDAQLSHDLGTLLFAFNLMWVYLSFSQYLIIWAGDLPHEVAWYAARQRGAAGLVGTILLVLHFLIPFAMLLSVERKRSPNQLAVVATLLFVMRIIDLGWTVLPSTSGMTWQSWLGLAASAGLLGSVWGALFHYCAARLPVVDAELLSEHPEMPLADRMEATA